MTFDFEEQHDSLFDSSSTSASSQEGLAVCLGEDLRFGKGVASAFKQRFGNHQHQLQTQKRVVGQVVHITVAGASSPVKRHVFYLISRAKVYNRTNYADFEACLVQLRKATEQLGVWRLAVPHDFGTDGLQEKHIKELLFKVFHGWQGKMVMYNGDSV
ncbi:hypothetical protein BDB00DRAFT_807206 [Zychaea mexicana]|uniref:uncharacterized protein n=1 Tax=Zychaea mexicana TaxID=64656 RepID=UPI0022FF3056|nr:uncharacterized protein BDB00DRAFT_807206 [Zychaea mexicana]KAI9496803.1 hypothetical protein BDB00DRAFT_807206 [Zychaea mexicana]